jgi:hypothetical protein
MFKSEWTPIAGQRILNSALRSNEYAGRNQGVAPELTHVYITKFHQARSRDNAYINKQTREAETIGLIVLYSVRGTLRKESSLPDELRESELVKE